MLNSVDMALRSGAKAFIKELAILTITDDVTWVPVLLAGDARMITCECQTVSFHSTASIVVSDEWLTFAVGGSADRYCCDMAIRYQSCRLGFGVLARM